MDPAMAAAACVRSRVAGAAAAVGVGEVGCVAKGATMADQANGAETEKAVRAVAILAAGSAKGAHAARGWVVEAAAVAEEKEMEAETAMTAAVEVVVGRVGMEAQVREAEVAVAGMAVAEAQTGTKRRPAPRRRLRTHRACRSPHAVARSALMQQRSEAPSWREKVRTLHRIKLLMRWLLATHLAAPARRPPTLIERCDDQPAPPTRRACWLLRSIDCPVGSAPAEQ